MQVMFVLGLEFALSESDELAPSENTRIGLQDGMTFTGSASTLNRSWGTIEGALAEAGHRLRSFKCGVWAPGFEQFEEAELPIGSAANAQHCMHVGLGQLAEVSTQTTERVEKALMTPQSIERFATNMIMSALQKRGCW